MTFQVKLNDPNAKIPERMDTGAAGYDLTSCEDKIIEAHSYKVVNTGIQMAIPNGIYGRIAPRSGLACKHGINVGAGVIDSSYRGNIGVVLFNHGDDDFNIKIGDRIAQLILEVIITPIPQLVDELNITSRNQNGWGSTGK